MVPEMLKPGQAKLVKAGSDLVFQLQTTRPTQAGLGQDPGGPGFLEDAADGTGVSLAATKSEIRDSSGRPELPGRRGPSSSRTTRN